MNYSEFSQEDCAQAMSKIFVALSQILLNPTSDSSELFINAKVAFNAVADEVEFGGARFKPVDFNDDYLRNTASLFYGVGDKTFGLTASFWITGAAAVASSETHEIYQIFAESGLANTSTLPEDHLAVELCFVSHLLQSNKISEAKNFITDKIDFWWLKAEKHLATVTNDHNIKNFFTAISTSLAFVREL